MEMGRYFISDREFMAIQADWKANRIMWVTALRRLCEIGWTVEQAATWLSQN